VSEWDGGARLEAYPLNRCPHCGDNLAAPDANLDRRCPGCHYTVCASVVTWETTDAPS
jgi:phage FluMu protein Com